MEKPKVIMPPYKNLIYKLMYNGEYKFFNQKDVDELKAILEYHRPYREWMAKE